MDEHRSNKKTLLFYLLKWSHVRGLFAHRDGEAALSGSSAYQLIVVRKNVNIPFFFEVQDKIPKHYIYLWMEEILQLVTIGRWDYNSINHLHKFVKDFFHPQLIFNYIHTLGEATLSILWVSLSWGTLRQSGNMRHPKGKIPWLTFSWLLPMDFTVGIPSGNRGLLENPPAIEIDDFPVYIHL